MLKRIVAYSLAGVLGIALMFTVAGLVIKRQGQGRIAPGVTVCGLNVSGMTLSEAEMAIRGLVPECTTELRCRFLPEMREETELRIEEINLGMQRKNGMQKGSIKTDEEE